MPNRREFDLIPESDKGGRNIYTDDMKEIVEFMENTEIGKEHQQELDEQKLEQGKQQIFEKINQNAQSGYGIEKVIEYLESKEFSESLQGGFADGRKIEDFDIVQLAMGALVELEHTNDFIKAIEISMDHLVEDPKYYTHLEEMEQKYVATSKKRKSKAAKGPESSILEEDPKVQDAIKELSKFLESHGEKPRTPAARARDTAKRLSPVPDLRLKSNLSTDELKYVDIIFRDASKAVSDCIMNSIEFTEGRKKAYVTDFKNNSVTVEDFITFYYTWIARVNPEIQKQYEKGVQSENKKKEIEDAIKEGYEGRLESPINQRLMNEQVSKLNQLTDDDMIKSLYNDIFNKGIDKSKAIDKALEFQRRRQTNANSSKKEKKVMADKNKTEAYFQGTVEPEIGKSFQMGDEQATRQEDKQMVGKGMESGSDGMHPGYEAGSDEKVKEMLQRAKDRANVVKSYFQGTVEPDLGSTFQMGDEKKTREEDKQMVGKGMESGNDGMHPGYDAGSDEKVKEMLQRAKERKEIIKSSLNKKADTESCDIVKIDQDQMAVICPSCSDDMKAKNISQYKIDLNEITEPEIKEAFIQISKKADCGTCEADDEEDKEEEKKEASMDEQILKKAQNIQEGLANIADMLDEKGAHNEATAVDEMIQGLNTTPEVATVTDSLQEIQENRVDEITNPQPEIENVPQEAANEEAATEEVVNEEVATDEVPAPEVTTPEEATPEYDEITIDQFKEHIENLKFPLSHRQKKEKYEVALEKVEKAKEYKEAYEAWLDDAHKSLDDEPIRFKL